MQTETTKTGRYTSRVDRLHNDGSVYDSNIQPRIGALIRDIMLGFAALITMLLSWYIVPEGHRGVISKFSKAVYQTDPGLHFKVPWMHSVVKIEVRERRSIEQLAAATQNRLPVTVDVSINWLVHPDSAMDLFIKYGSLDQFEQRILDPRLRQAAKAAISQFDADLLIRERQNVAALILQIMSELVEGYPVTITSPQLENVALPPAYLNSVLVKEQAREDALREQYNLDKQKLEAQREVQSAIAKRDSTIAIADGNAYEIERLAVAHALEIRELKSAEAEGIKEVEAALSANPLYVDYVRATQWDGVYPQTMLGGDTNLLLGLK